VPWGGRCSGVVREGASALIGRRARRRCRIEFDPGPRRHRRGSRASSRRCAGFSAPELLILIALVLILVIGGKAILDGWSTRGVGFGVNGVVETRCIEGRKVLVGQSGSVQQLLDDEGGGIPCSEPDRGGIHSKGHRSARSETIPR
jgi:hypothetical protein